VSFGFPGLPSVLFGSPGFFLHNCRRFFLAILPKRHAHFVWPQRGFLAIFTKK